MKKYFIDLFEYNNWANDKIILKLKPLDEPIDPMILKLLGHIISVQETWLERVKGTTAYNIFLWDDYSLQEIEVLSINSHNGWIKYLKKFKEENLEHYCDYKNSKGEKLSKTFQDIFQHVINHSTYHRGQINCLFKKNNIEPLILDFIYYC